MYPCTTSLAHLNANAPELAAGRGDEQVPAVAVVELPRLVADLRVLDFLDPEHLGVFPG